MLPALTRRELLGTTAVCLSAVSSPGAASRLIDIALGVHATALEEFGYGDVELSSGPHEAQLEQLCGVLIGLDEDSLMRPFRIAADLPAPGGDLGGWYSAPRFLGETFGQWLSVLSRYHAARPDPAVAAKVERLLHAFIETIGSSRIFKANGNPLYFHDKLTLGLVDSALVLGSGRSAAALVKFANSSRDVMEGKHSATGWAAPDNIDKSATLGGYNFAETYLSAWKVSGDPRYLKLAQEDLDDGFCEPLSRGRNVLAGKHAYSHMNTLCSAARAYLEFGDETYLRAAVNGLSFAEQQSFATGTYGPGEGFLPRRAHAIDGKPGGTLETPGDAILHSAHHFETGCGSYAHFKLTRYLLRITRKPGYGDSMERVMYNAALGALPLNKFGKAFYQSSYERRARKKYFDGYNNIIEDEWPCCSGSLPQLAADYRISTYFRDPAGLWINLYIPSSVRWRSGGAEIMLSQTGEYPLADSMNFKIEISSPAVFTVRFRIPAWTQNPGISINGAAVAQPCIPGTFAAVRRKWRSGDRIEVMLPKHLELKPADGKHPNLAALCCGPMVLFAIGDELPQLGRATLLAARQASASAPEWRSGDFRFLPWWAIKDETYTTYHQLS